MEVKESQRARIIVTVTPPTPNGELALESALLHISQSNMDK
ncbi:hypothetical protein [Veronia nyctiphanis]|nr:hypothetical protein [Veronia nyctiphanis]